MKPERRLISSWSAPGRGATFKGALQQNFNRTLNVFAHTTALAVESNTITLDPDVKDAWGLPALRVTYKNHPDDLRTMAFFRDRALDLLVGSWRHQEVGISRGRGDHVGSLDGHLPHGQ